MRWLSVLSAGTLVTAATVAFGNCGSIPFVAGAQVYRPYQRAVTAFDGREQILLLSTDLRADRPTKVLEVLPFPSEPDITPGDGELFQKATQLIEDKLLERGLGRRTSKKPGIDGRDGSAVYHERIDVRHPVVVRFLDGREFIDWF